MLNQPGASLIIALASLSISILTALVNLRHGRINIARPSRVLLFPESIYADLLLIATGMRGKMLGELVLRLTTPDGSHYQLTEWIHIRKVDNQYLQRVSAFISHSGYAASHEWFFKRDGSTKIYSAGPHAIEIFDVTNINNISKSGRCLFSVKFEISREDAQAINSQGPLKEGFVSGFIELSWNFFQKRYEVHYRPQREVSASGTKDPPEQTLIVQPGVH